MQLVYDSGMDLPWKKRLREAVARAGVSDIDLGRACGVRPSSVHGWLEGDTKEMTANNLLLASKFLKVSPFWVLFGEAGGPESSEPTPIDAAQISKLIILFAQCSERRKALVLETMENWIRGADDSQGGLAANEPQ